MKKALSLLLVFVMAISLCACRSNSPTDKLNKYITENGEKKGDSTVVAFEDGIDIIKSPESTFSNHSSGNDSVITEIQCNIIKEDDKYKIEIIDYLRPITISAAISFEREITLDFDGNIEYKLFRSSYTDVLGITAKCKISPETYTANDMPEIIDSQSYGGASFKGTAIYAMKDCVILALDCLEAFLAQDGLELTMADIGFKAYSSDK